MNFFSTIATFYKEGGLFMHAVLVIGVLVIAIIVERMIVIGRASSVNAKKLTDDLVQRVSRGDTAGARQLVLNDGAPAAVVAQALLDTKAQDERSLQAAGEDAAALVLPDLTKRLAYLSMLANSATLIGLLGTITGLITAISGIGVADAAQRSAYLAAGISEALHTTAFGLMIAIPTLLIQGWLANRVEGIADGMDQVAIRMAKAMDKASGHAPAHPAPIPMPRPAAAAPQSPATGTHGGGR